ncbi:MAG TPA: ATPase, partial [Clostridiales bacterium]|nr:ATPase [Clostridiales bacterium]
QEAVIRIQRAILDSYVLDFAKHAPKQEFDKLTAIWYAVPAQLAQENQKFIFSRVKAGARARDLEGSLQWLISAGLIYKVPKIEKPGIPLSAYTDDSFFKIYLCDVGLVSAMAGIPLLSIKKKDPIFTQFCGALTENYVLTELVSRHLDPVFWRSQQNAEVDFICRIKQQLVPIEVKSDENVRSKSLLVYLDKYKPLTAVRLSMKNASLEPPLISAPLYLASRLANWI